MRVAVAMSEQIELTQTIWRTADSSPAIRLESTALKWPPNPSGPTFIYIFKATAEGEAQVKVPIVNSDDPGQKAYVFDDDPCGTAHRGADDPSRDSDARSGEH